MKKLIFISGAGRGIGQAIALKLSENTDYIVCGCARTSSDLEKTESLSNEKIRTQVLDVTDSKGVENWITKEISQTKAAPWGLITAAGVYGPIGPFVENSFEDWKKATEINVFGTALLVKFFTQKLITAKLEGRVILLSGGGATQPQPNFSSYGACKAAVVRFGETIAHELKSFNITVNSVAPGAVNTKFTEDLLKAGPDKVGNETYEKVLKQKESGGTSPDKAASLCSYLLSEKAKNITGRLISAVWDNWENLHEKALELSKSDIYTLRRIIPEDRQKDFSK
jgi:NAD(P)-dependent dehydrogenase (short-subunit alcohol dehydrogenase family)